MTYTEPQFHDQPARDVLTVDGAGPTESPSFGAAISALYATRAALGSPADVPMEGTYRQADGRPFDLTSPDGWVWSLAVPAPDGATTERVTEVGSDGVRLEQQPGGRYLQLEHQGPYADESASLAALRDAAVERDLQIIDAHTEVYLNDPTQTPPDELRTLLRYPLAPPR